MKKECILLVLLLSYLGIAYGDIQEGLVAYYPFNGNVNDESGNGHNGIKMNGVTLTNDRFGNPDSAYFFDGKDDYIRIIDHDSFELANVKTIGGWIKKANSYSNYAIITKYKNDTPDENGWIVGTYKDDNLTIINSWFKGLEGERTGYVKQEFIFEKWYFFCVTISGNEPVVQMDLYVNGNKVDSTELSTNEYFSVGNQNDVLIGACYGKTSGYISNSSYFYGIIDDIRIYNRALSEIEIKQLYSENDYIQTCNCPDFDQDGVADQWDHCSTTPPSTAIYSDGCRAEDLYIKIDKLSNNYIELSQTHAALLKQYNEMNSTLETMYTKDQMEKMISDILEWGDSDNDGKVSLQEIIKKLMIISGVIPDK